MPRQKRNSARVSPKAFVILAVAAVTLFAAGQAFRVTHSDAGAIMLARHLGMGDGDRVAAIIGTEIRRGLVAMATPVDSLKETLNEDGTPERRWHLDVPPGTSLLQLNHAITHYVEQVGGSVLSGIESTHRDGTPEVKLLIGLPGRPTHEVVLAEPPTGRSGIAPEPARMAIVLYGFGEDPEHAAAQFDLPVPFAAAIVPGEKWSSAMFRAANDRKREVVLHLPLEPLHYPRNNPGPGTILVTMSGSHITGVLRKYLDQAGDASAVANYTGQLATQDMTVMKAIFKELGRQRLAFMEIDPVPGSVCDDLAADMGVAYSEPDIAFNPARWSGDRRELDRRWRALLATAKERRRLVVWMRASETVAAWLPGATTQDRLDGVHLVPLSALVQAPIPL